MFTLTKETFSRGTSRVRDYGQRRRRSSSHLVRPMLFNTLIEIVKEITEKESEKFEVTMPKSIETILNLVSYKGVDEALFRTDILFKEGKYGYFNALLIDFV